MSSNASRPQPSRVYTAPLLSRSSTSSSNTSGSASPSTHHYPQQQHARTKTDEPGYFSAQAPSSSLASPTQFHVNYTGNTSSSSRHNSNNNTSTNNAFTNAFNAAYYGTSSNPNINNSNSNSYTYTTHSTGPTAPYPIITATITSRHPPPSSSNRSTPEEEDSNPYSQFAMHIPGPPTTLSLGGGGGRSSHHRGGGGGGNGPQVLSSSSHHRSQQPPQQPLPSPLDRTRRMPPPSSRSTPQMQVTSSVYAYTLSVQLPAAIQPEMVTVCANKGDKIKVVADVWHLEDESHYEWQIAFPPYDIDMGNVHARFDDSRNLTIDVRRIPRIYR
ncbi:hypothetical protein BKA70DRAFT_725706 [Coprinopsis sp. MPI-PUGE-AT-0042]|nr:hypothetical protein BKA70DRAFT_725706 [Coprinopsis sp. MPI-PUGE-AT-0042]